MKMAGSTPFLKSHTDPKKTKKPGFWYPISIDEPPEPQLNILLRLDHLLRSAIAASL